jgi:hypothetical protein
MDPTMATTMSREEVRRIAWRVSMSEVERAAHDFGYVVQSPASVNSDPYRDDRQGGAAGTAELRSEHPSSGVLEE